MGEREACVRFLNELLPLPKTYVKIPLSVDDKQPVAKLGEKGTKPRCTPNWELLRVDEVFEQAVLVS